MTSRKPTFWPANTPLKLIFRRAKQIPSRGTLSPTAPYPPQIRGRPRVVSSCLILFTVFGMPITVPAAPRAPAPCVDAKACSEPLGLPGSSRWVRIYRTYSLTAQNAAVTRAFILVHGFQRDADSHFRTAVAGGLLAGCLGDTVIVAPRFASRSDASSHPAGNSWCATPS